MVRRDASSFNAFGTMLLSQDVGQSLFLSAKLEGLGVRNGVSGELRVIARRVFLHKLPTIDAKGRGTLDATLKVQAGLVSSASWQASVRELEIGDDPRARFDHFTVNGKLERDAGDFVLKFADLQLTREARLERAAKLIARLSIEPGTTRIARTTLTAERLPFMAAEFMAGLLGPQFADRMAVFPADWNPIAGELRALRFDSRGSTLSAQLSGAELVRTSDHLHVSNLAAQMQYDEKELRLSFAPDVTTSLRIAGDENPRAFNLAGQLAVSNTTGGIEFKAFDARSGATLINAQGQWGSDRPLILTVTNLDRASDARRVESARAGNRAARAVLPISAKAAWSKASSIWCRCGTRRVRTPSTGRGPPAR